MKSLSCVCPSVHVSLRLSVTNFSEDWIIFIWGWGWDLVAWIWAKGAKIEPETRFFVIFSSLIDWFSLKLHTLSFHYFLRVASLVLFDIAQDCSLGQFLTSSRAETTKKILGPNRPRSMPKWFFLFWCCWASTQTCLFSLKCHNFTSNCFHENACTNYICLNIVR